jgi:nucleotide-binding universal stress UspA family protein
MHHVLVCLDFSTLSKQIIPFAVTLARGFGARITVLHVLEGPQLDPHTQMDCFEWQIKKNEVKRYLEGIKSEISHCGVLVATETVEGQPAEQIDFWINTHHVDLTVLCSHGTNGQKQWPLASTAQKLISGTSRALFLIPAKALENYESNDISIQRLLVPLDGSSWAESALPFAINIANEQKCDVVLAHVIPESALTHIEPLNPEGLMLEQRVHDYNWNVALNYLCQIESRLKPATNISVHTSHVNSHGISHELIKIVDDQAIDMVVMSAHGNSNQQDHYCGKVALDFLEHCNVPVMLLRGQISPKELSVKPNYSLIESTSRLPSLAAL